VTSGDDLLSGPSAVGLPGDYRLDNGLVAFVFSALGRPVGRLVGGGHLVDAALAGGEDALWSLSFQGAVYERMRLESRAGGAAALVVGGRDAAEPDLRVETTYILRPSARVLEIETRVTNTGEHAFVDRPLGDRVWWGRTEPYADTVGAIGGPMDLPDQIWMGAAGERVGYAYAAEAGRAFHASHTPAGATTELDRATLAPGGDWTVVRYLGVGGRGDVLSALEAVWPKLSGVAAPGTVAITVREHASVVKVPGARVEFVTARGGVAGRALADEKGEVTAMLPAGKYFAAADGPGRVAEGETEIEVAAGRATKAAVTTSTYGHVEYTVRESGAPVAARITLVGDEPGGAGSGASPPDLGPLWSASGAGHVLYTKGAGILPLPPGRWVLVASRGPEYDLASAVVEVHAGETAKADLEMVRIAPTPGYVAADLHLHCEGDDDSAVSLEDRVLAAAAEGLELVALVNHDALPGPAPSLDALGLTGEIGVLLATEATTAGGHLLVVPAPELEPAPRTLGLPFAQAVALWRARAPKGALAVTHPRGEDGAFAWHELDAGAMKLGRPGFSADFDLVEVATGGDAAASDAALADWFALLNAGKVYTAVGGSDAHDLAGSPAGVARTLVGIGDAAPGSPDAAAAAIEALRLGRNAVVTNGPFVELKVGGAAPGALVKPGLKPPAAAPAKVKGKAPAPKAPKLPPGAKGIEVSVTVSAAPWISVARVALVERGVVVKEWTVPARPDPVRLRETIVVPVTRDTWYAVLVRGDRPMDPIVPGVVPFAVTNPVFVDKNGNGKYDP